jgi:hypothetical protein
MRHFSAGHRKYESEPGKAVRPPPPFGDIVWNLLVIIAVLWLVFA